MSKSSATALKTKTATQTKRPAKTPANNKTKTKVGAKTKPLVKREKKTTKKPEVKTKQKVKAKERAQIKNPKTRPAQVNLKKENSTVQGPSLFNKQSILKRNPLGHLLIEKILLEQGFKGEVHTDDHTLTKYSTDDGIYMVKPQVVIKPKTTKDVEIVTKIIAEQTKRFESLSLTPRANGTSSDGSSLSDSIIIDTSTHLTKISEMDIKSDKVIFSVEAGASWCKIESSLKEVNAYLPVCSHNLSPATIGGAVSCDSFCSHSANHNSCSDLVLSIDMILADGNTYTIKPLTYKEFKALKKEDNEYARIVREVFNLIKKQEKESINTPTKRSSKKTPQTPLSQILPQGTEAFSKNEGVFDLMNFIAGSQGTVGIITNIKMQASLRKPLTRIITVPIFQLEDLPIVINKINKYDPICFNILDKKTLDRALVSPNFFKGHIEGLAYYRSMLSLYTTYHVRYQKRSPEFILVATLDLKTTADYSDFEIVTSVNTSKTRSRMVSVQDETEILEQLNKNYYALAKYENRDQRPATLLKPVSVPADKLIKFMNSAKNMFKEFNVPFTIYGEGRQSKFYYYPHLDFTQRTIALLIEKINDRFYGLASRYNAKVFEEASTLTSNSKASKQPLQVRILDEYTKIERIFDPDDIFNSGKKTNPNFDIGGRLRNTN